MSIDLSPWPGLVILEPVTEGNRSEVWRGQFEGQVVSVRRTRRSLASLEWELDLIEFLHARGFRVPKVIETPDGRWHSEGVVVQTWLDGDPPETPAEWEQVGMALVKLHEATSGRSQRPGCLMVTELDLCSCSVDADLSRMPDDVADEVLSVFEALGDCDASVIHGDPGSSNIVMGRGGQVGLLDFDESRVDLTWHDLSNAQMGVLSGANLDRARQLSHAWEVANAWKVEPGYALERLAELRLTYSK